ncbi:MAG TPA: hypothetical protein VID25_03935 [Candidatus Limnocylindrales bacterium]|jgi:type IV secretory pathway VirB2 component (pilin)
MVDVIRTIDLYGPFWLLSSVWIVLAGGVALLAGRRGLNPFLWFVVGLVASPLATLILLALITPRGGGHPPA